MHAAMTTPTDTPAGSRPTARRAMNLRRLLAGIADAAVPDLGIVDICLDSREAVPGSLFLAVPGSQGHGLEFLSQAARNGARVVLWEPAAGVGAPDARDDLILIAVPGLKQLIGRIADRFFDNPSACLGIAGITGTNGKTTTAHLVAGAMSATGAPTAYSGTLGYGHLDALKSSAHTTPDPITVHRRLAEFCDAGDRHLSMEVSSHALDQGRVEAVRFHTAVFTNLTRDHLDYHNTFAAYGAAKARLFATPGLDHAVINVGDPFGDELVRRLAGQAAVTAYHVGPSGDTAPTAHRLFARQIRRGASGGDHTGLSLDFAGSWGSGVLNSPLIGDFNAENLLAALAVLLGWEVPLDRAVAALEQCGPPPGRMEVVATNPLVVVDYAHTPDALAKALRVLRQHTPGQVTCVFGCGGERDRGKRPLMGRIAEELADAVVLTDDNPRREDPEAIVAEIVAGLKNPRAARIERDRARAIAIAIGSAVPGDAVLVAGKGHENYQLIGTASQPFSDREAALAVLRASSC